MKKVFALLGLTLTALLTACPGNTTPPPEIPTPPVPDTSNAVTYGSQSYAVSAGLAEYEGAEGEHYHVNIGATDGTYYPIFYHYYDLNGYVIATITIWLVADAKVDVRAELFSAGTDAFRVGTFTFADGSGDPPAGMNFFEGAYVGIDADADGEITEAEEIAVMGGTITVSGTQPNFTTTYDLQLANGLSATGSYAGTHLVVED